MIFIYYSIGNVSIGMFWTRTAVVSNTITTYRLASSYLCQKHEIFLWTTLRVSIGTLKVRVHSISWYSRHSSSARNYTYTSRCRMVSNSIATLFPCEFKEFNPRNIQYLVVFCFLIPLIWLLAVRCVTFAPQNLICKNTSNSLWRLSSLFLHVPKCILLIIDLRVEYVIHSSMMSEQAISEFQKMKM